MSETTFFFFSHYLWIIIIAIDFNLWLVFNIWFESGFDENTNHKKEKYNSERTGFKLNSTALIQGLDTNSH